MMSTWENVMRENATADLFLWRNVKRSVGVLSGATTIWIIVELLEYHFLTLVCQVLILALVVSVIWSSAANFINMSPPHILDVKFDEELCLEFASALTYQLNCALGVLQEVASGQGWKKFLVITFGLWMMSVIGSWFNFLTLLYISCVLLHTIPVIYEKNGHTIDAYVGKTVTEIKKHYVVFDEKVLSTIRRGTLKDEKRE